MRAPGGGDSTSGPATTLILPCGMLDNAVVIALAILCVCVCVCLYIYNYILYYRHFI